MEAKMTLYEMAKQMVSNEKVMDPILANLKIKDIADSVIEGHYYLLFNPDLRQYVFFSVKDKNNMKRELTEVLSNRGQFLLFDEASPGIWEIWIKDMYDEKPYMYQFCDYTDGVVEV